MSCWIRLCIGYMFNKALGSLGTSHALCIGNSLLFLPFLYPSFHYTQKGMYYYQWGLLDDSYCVNNNPFKPEAPTETS